MRKNPKIKESQDENNPLSNVDTAGFILSFSDCRDLYNFVLFYKSYLIPSSVKYEDVVRAAPMHGWWQASSDERSISNNGGRGQFQFIPIGIPLT